LLILGKRRAGRKQEIATSVTAAAPVAKKEMSSSALARRFRLT
jgi:hypothetical protein